jgi:putative ATPase
LLILIGATTENPSFELNSALLSRCRVVPLEPLSREALAKLLSRALADRERGLGELGLALDDGAREWLLDRADGDARALLTDLEWVALGCEQQGVKEATRDQVAALLARKAPRYDATGDEHYNLISALHKSLRGSDVQAGVYWLARMLEGGEDPLYVARRLVRFASEDVGAADPQALVVAIAARDAIDFIGMPEGALALAEAVVYLATSPKSDRVYRAYSEAVEEVRRSGTLPVPLAIRNAPTRLMKDLGYGKGYVTPHESEAGDRLQFLPDALAGRAFYEPKELGFEREIGKRMAYYAERRKRT